jgi:hypothetical protein
MFAVYDLDRAAQIFKPLRQPPVLTENQISGNLAL